MSFAPTDGQPFPSPPPDDEDDDDLDVAAERLRAQRLRAAVEAEQAAVRQPAPANASRAVVTPGRPPAPASALPAAAPDRAQGVPTLGALDGDAEPKRPRRARQGATEYRLQVGRGAAHNACAVAAVDVVRALGTASLATLVRVVQLTTGVHEQSAYKASRSLEAAGVVRRAWVRRDLDSTRAALVGIVVQPGPAWPTWHREHFGQGLLDLDGPGEIGGLDRGLTPRPTLTLGDNRADAAMRQLALSSEVLRRVLAGWTLVNGNQWLDGAAAYTIARLPELGRGVALSRARQSGRLALPDGGAVVGLLPPADTPVVTLAETRRRRRARRSNAASGPVPALLVGGRWGGRTAYRASARTFGEVAPFEILTTGMRSESLELLRETTWDAVAGRAYCPITQVRIGRSAIWKAVAEAIDAGLRQDPRIVRARLAAWLAGARAADIGQAGTMPGGATRPP